MTMVLASGAEDIGSDVVGGSSAGTNGSSPSGRNFGLTGGQRAAAAGRLVPQGARTHHPYIVGLSLITLGLLALVGSVTGTLPSMIAALFVPQALGPSPTADVPVINLIPIIGSGTPTIGGPGFGGFPAI